MVALEGGTAAAGAVSLLFYNTPLAVCLFALSGLSCVYISVGGAMRM